MASLRKIAECLELTGNISVIHDLLGYRTNFNGRSTSLLQQVRLLQIRHIGLNIIRVGSDNFTFANEQTIDSTVQTARNIYATINIGIGRIRHFVITVADANGRDIITDDAEASTLTDEWTVPNDSFDVFFVLNGWGTTIGLSAINGPCDKNSSGGMTGSVVAVAGGLQTLAHEVGHYLGLSHVCEMMAGGGCLSGTCQTSHQSSLMFPCIPNGGTLTNTEGQTMQGHCFVHSGCPGN
jgi:hypothetical protein